MGVIFILDMYIILPTIERILATIVFTSFYLLIYVTLTKIKPLGIKDFIENLSEKIRGRKLLTILSLILTWLAVMALNIILNTSYIGMGIIFGFFLTISGILCIDERHFLDSIKPYIASSTISLFLFFMLLGGNLNTVPGFFNVSKDRLPPQIKEITRANRLSQDIEDGKILYDFYNLLYKFDNFDDEPCVPYYEDLEFNEQIPITKAIEDVDYLFGILKYGYAAYGYFGGDDTFLRAKEEIISAIEEHEESIFRGDFIKILVDNLDFLQDGHFRVETHQMFQRYNYYSNEDYTFYKDEEGYHTFINGEIFQLAGVSGGNIDEFLKPSINDDGKIVYYLGNLYPSSGREHIIEIELESENSVITKNISKRIATYTSNTAPGSIYRYNEVNGIPIVQIGSMFPQSESQVNLLNDFIDDARKLRGEKHFIIDLRGNNGGYADYPTQWIENYSRQSFGADYIVSDLHTSTTMAAYERFTESIVTEDHRRRSLESIDEIKSGKYYPGWSAIQFDLPKQLRNNNVIFVLIDGGVASSAESYVKMLRQMDNVIFIGENTAGISLVGNNNLFLLPNSMIAVQFGKSLYLNLDLTDNEGIGFRPDFWVPAGDSLDRTVRFIENYFIK